METKSHITKSINISLALAMIIGCGVANAGKPTKPPTPTDPPITSSSLAGKVAGEAYSLNLNLNTLDLLKVQLGPIPYVSLFSTGGFASESLLQASLLDLVDSKTLLNTTIGGIGASKAGAVSISAVEDLELLGGIIRADLITSICTSYGNGSAAGSQAAGNLVNLVIGGKSISASTAPNTSVYIGSSGGLVTSLLGLLTPPPVEVIINEQIPSGNGSTTSGIIRNALHVKVNASLLSLNVTSGDVVVSSAKCGVDATKVSQPPAADATGFVTGGGQLNNATFGFNARPGRGQLQYIDHTTKLKVHSESIDADTFLINGNCATFTGVTKDGLDFTATACDNGEPGKDVDTFSIQLSDSYSNSGVISGGNIQLH